MRARVTGILEKKLFQEGAPVKPGQVLFVIDPKPLEAQVAALEAEVARAQAQKAQAERELARLKPLAERRAVGQKEADDAQSNVDLANASVKAAQAKLAEVQLNLGYTRVTAPIAGLSSRAPKSEGSLVNANETLLTTVSQVDPMWIPFSIAENEQLALNRAVTEGRLTLPKNNAFDVTRAPGRRLDARPPWPHQLRGHADQPVDRDVRDARRDRERRRRAQAGPVRPREARRAPCATTRSPCRRSPCSTARRASSSTSPRRTRTARTSRACAR